MFDFNRVWSGPLGQVIATATSQGGSFMQHTFQRTRRLAATLVFLIVVAAAVSGATKSEVATATPIQHLVVIFQENVSFDHYFATYPNALNPPGEPSFSAKADTPTVNGLAGALLTQNPNS